MALAGGQLTTEILGLLHKLLQYLPSVPAIDSINYMAEYRLEPAAEHSPCIVPGHKGEPSAYTVLATLRGRVQVDAGRCIAPPADIPVGQHMVLRSPHGSLKCCALGSPSTIIVLQATQIPDAGVPERGAEPTQAVCRHWVKGRCKLPSCRYRHAEGETGPEDWTRLHTLLTALEQERLLQMVHVTDTAQLLPQAAALTIQKGLQTVAYGDSWSGRVNVLGCHPRWPCCALHARTGCTGSGAGSHTGAAPTLCAAVVHEAKGCAPVHVVRQELGVHPAAGHAQVQWTLGTMVGN